MELYTNSFCSISKNEDWQSWLNAIAPELHSDLMKTLEAKKGCRSNSEKMQEIYSKLYKKNLGTALETFVERRFPWLIKKVDEKQTPQKIVKPKQTQINEQNQIVNKHGIFKAYNPNLLTFPQKLILVGPTQSLHNRAKEFCKDKLGTDYIIVDDRAYIEYFLPKFSHIIDKYPKESREIFKYRLKLSQQNEK